jgi:hypothetical protein
VQPGTGFLCQYGCFGTEHREQEELIDHLLTKHSEEELWAFSIRKQYLQKFREQRVLGVRVNDQKDVAITGMKKGAVEVKRDLTSSTESVGSHHSPVPGVELFS